MEPLAMLHADHLDLLFENRNKSYGAYNLRKYYPQRLMISMGVTFSMVVICSASYLYFHTTPLTVREYIIPDNKIDPIVYPSKVKLVSPPVRPFAPKPPASVKLTTPLIVPDQKVPESMPAIENLQTAVIGTVTSAGEADKGGLSNNGMEGAGTATQAIPTVENNPEVLDIAQVMPEFPGGIEALKRFLLKNLRMPENGLEPGMQVRVVAKFVVGADGRVRDVVIIQAAEAVFNSEVKRVISKMPDWKPGSQNHRNVAVYYNLPVNFVAAE